MTSAWPWAKSSRPAPKSTTADGEDELHLVFNFALLQQRWKAQAFRDVVQAWYDKLPDGAWPCWVLNNHDNRRSISRYAAGEHTEARAKVAATMLLTLRGTPFLYYGEELGLPEGKIPRAEIVDPPGRKYWPILQRPRWLPHADAVGRDDQRRLLNRQTVAACESRLRPRQRRKRTPRSEFVVELLSAVDGAAACFARLAARLVSRPRPHRAMSMPTNAPLPINAC